MTKQEMTTMTQKQDEILTLLHQLVSDKIDDHDKLDVLWKVVVQGDEEKKIIPILETLRNHERTLAGVTRIGWAVLAALIVALIPITIDIIVHVESAH